MKVFCNWSISHHIIEYSQQYLYKATAPVAHKLLEMPNLLVPRVDRASGIDKFVQNSQGPRRIKRQPFFVDLKNIIEVKFCKVYRGRTNNRIKRLRVQHPFFTWNLFNVSLLIRAAIGSGDGSRGRATTFYLSEPGLNPGKDLVFQL